MKKPEDYGSIMGINEEQYNRLIGIIKEAQKDAYNDAIEDAKEAVNRMAIDHTSIMFAKESINKLKEL